MLEPRGGDLCPSHRVSFDKINSKLPGFKTEWTEGAEQPLEIFSRIKMTEEVFASDPYTGSSRSAILLESQ